jgi:glycosyltransferase involved in cell wall biosynthesis
MSRYAFVVPRAGTDIVGGAEALMQAIARRVAQMGHEVEIVSTCARDNRTWANEYEAGVSVEEGISVRRFQVDPRNLERWIPIQIAISEGIRPTLEDQLEWMTESVNSAGLYEYIRDFGETFDALFFGPYLFGVTFWASQIHPERSILVPCLHDEHYAYLDIMRALFQGVRGALFNAAPERDLARALYGEITGGEVGLGFDFGEYEKARLDIPYFKEQFPYLLYAGRKETGKNAHLLVDYFVSGKEAGIIDPDVKLVFIGGGSFDDLGRPQALVRGDVIDLGKVDERDKLRIMRYAKALTLLSTNESFSIVIMEAWLLGVPVIVHGECAVTREHVLTSGGGLPVKSMEEFAHAAQEIVRHPELAEALSRAGEGYVRHRYSWPAVLERFESTVEEICRR